MGLDCSHDAFSGAYSAFNRLRQAVCKAAGGSYPPHEDSSKDGSMFYLKDAQKPKNRGLYIFLAHSDCDGEISAKDCKLVADQLEKLVPAVDLLGDGGGHIGRQGGYGAVLRKFIAGCREAAEKNEPLEFQ